MAMMFALLGQAFGRMGAGSASAASSSAFAPSLDFSNALNSQYIALLEDI